MKKTLMIALLIASTQAQAATAFWTGRSEQVQSVTYQMMWRCEYNYNGQTFFLMFKSFCPSSVNVQ